MSSPDSISEFISLITTGLENSGLQPGDYPVTAFATYLDLLERWNRAYNLTGIRDRKSIITHHILDSLSVLPFVHGERCLDVGTGAGLPGLILALATPAKQWNLLDSSHKKIRFIRQAITELNICNIEAVCSRVEDYNTDRPFSTVITRAFGSLEKFYLLSRHLLAPGGKLLAMKGADISEELAGLDQEMVNVHIHPLKIRSITEQRTLVEINALQSAD